MREEKKINKRSQSWSLTHRNGIAFNAQTCTRSVAHEKEFVSGFSNSRRTHWRQTVNRTDKTVVCWVNSWIHNQAVSPVSKSARYSCSCLCEQWTCPRTAHTTQPSLSCHYGICINWKWLLCAVDRNICVEHTLWMKIPFSIWQRQRQRQWRPRHMHIHTVSITIVKHAIDTYFELVPFHCVYPMFFHARRLYLCVSSIVLMCSFVNIRFPFSPFIAGFLCACVHVYAERMVNFPPSVWFSCMYCAIYVCMCAICVARTDCFILYFHENFWVFFSVPDKSWNEAHKFRNICLYVFKPQRRDYQQHIEANARQLKQLHCQNHQQ